MAAEDERRMGGVSVVEQGEDKAVGFGSLPQAGGQASHSRSKELPPGGLERGRL